jgi:flagellar biogenesis protein FliO
MSFSYTLQLSLSILIMGGVLYGLLYLSKAMRRKRFSSEIKIKDRCPVDNGVAVLVVEVRGKDYLMSVSTKQATLLKELEPVEEANETT